ncbi:hypothetical protein [Thauera phenylacetica]|uniref:hypothetical protein n=1 Tax=Thauera phenylacetica TaxID=164400 RepID=UPI0039E47B2B
MDRILKVKHTADRHGRPLACIENMPGEGAEFSAAKLRALASTFNTIADECDMGAGLAYAETAEYDVQATSQQNPCIAYRNEICGFYSTAQRLSALVKHLYNGAAHPVRLDNLLSNADEHHSRIALELIAHYAKHGENCGVFMDLARRLVERDCTPADANADE